ncbi:hypothetical protein ACN6LE_002127 [Streptomyces hayashii]
MFTAVFQGAIAEVAKRDLVDVSLVSVDSTTVRAHRDAAGMIVAPETLDALEKAAAEKGAPARNKSGNRTLSGKNDNAYGVAARPDSPPPTWDVPAAV